MPSENRKSRSRTTIVPLQQLFLSLGASQSNISHTYFQKQLQAGITYFTNAYKNLEFKLKDRKTGRKRERNKFRKEGRKKERKKRKKKEGRKEGRKEGKEERRKRSLHLLSFLDVQIIGLSLKLGTFSPLFLQIFFLFHSLLSLWDSHYTYVCLVMFYKSLYMSVSVHSFIDLPSSSLIFFSAYMNLLLNLSSNFLIFIILLFKYKNLCFFFIIAISLIRGSVY